MSISSSDDLRRTPLYESSGGGSPVTDSSDRHPITPDLRSERRRDTSPLDVKPQGSPPIGGTEIRRDSGKQRSVDVPSLIIAEKKPTKKKKKKPSAEGSAVGGEKKKEKVKAYSVARKSTLHELPIPRDAEEGQKTPSPVSLSLSLPLYVF